jgi:hypothetical protein
MIARLMHKFHCMLAAGERRRMRHALEEIEREQWARKVVKAAQAVADGYAAAKAAQPSAPPPRMRGIYKANTLVFKGERIGTVGLN